MYSNQVIHPDNLKAALAAQPDDKCVVDKNGNVVPFTEHKASTCTFIVITNCRIDLLNLFNYCPITDFTPVVKRRGRKKRNNYEAPMTKLPFGSVIRVQHELKVRGVEIRKDDLSKIDPSQPRDPKANKKAYFLHCVTMVLVVNEEENITKNIKIYSNGKLQITGCKDAEQAKQTVKAVFQVFDKVELYTGQKVVERDGDNYRAVFNIVMQNINFLLGFNIFRNKLDQFINSIRDFEIKSIFENSLNTCVNIKIPIEEQEEKLLCIDYLADGTQVSSLVNKSDYNKQINKKNNKKEDEHTFLVFATGKVIFSSTPGPSMENIFYKIINLLINNRHLFEVVSNPSQMSIALRGASTTKRKLEAPEVDEEEEDVEV